MSCIYCLITGVNRFVADCKYMLGSAPRPIYFWVVCWAGCSPILIGVSTAAFIL